MTFIEFAKEKSEYSHCLLNFINLKLTHTQRYESYRRMHEIEELLKAQDDEIAIIISTKNTSKELPLVEITPELSFS